MPSDTPAPPTPMPKPAATTAPAPAVPAPKRLTPELAPGHTPSAEWFARALAPYKLLIGSLPFLFFAVESVLAVYSYHTYGDSDALLKLMFTQLLAVNCTLAGLLHFYPPLYTFYTSMIFVPFPTFWLYSTGLAFLVSGLMIAFSKTMVLGAWILTANLVLVLPGNVVCIFHTHPRNQVCAGSVPGAVMRTLFQFVFIRWAWWLTSGPLPITF